MSTEEKKGIKLTNIRKRRERKRTPRIRPLKKLSRRMNTNQLKKRRQKIIRNKSIKK